MMLMAFIYKTRTASKNSVCMVLSAVICLVLIWEGPFASFGGREAVAEEIRRDTKRMEASYTFESLSPNDRYGDWKNGLLSFYDNPTTGFTYFLKGALYERPDGSGKTGAFGAYIDWTDSFYTYTAATFGSNTVYLPKKRIDNDFNFKFGPARRYIFTLGFSDVDYFSEYRDAIFSVGSAVYWNRYVLQYRWFYNVSSPGNVTSDSHLICLGYGEEGRHWTYIDLSIGNQAYLVSYPDRSLTFDNFSYEASLQHRHWLGRTYGVLGTVEYFYLKNGYKKAGFSVGVFREF